MKRSSKKKPRSTFVRASLTIALALVTVIGLHALTSEKLPNHSITESTVEITNMAENSGGTGVVIDVDKSASTILTNNHVCELIKTTGGKVKTNEGATILIKSYLPDTEHDLCLVKIPKRLTSTAVLADREPNLYEKATVSGHPNLLPTVVTTGHFSDKMIIQVLSGVKKCTEEQEKSEDTALVCFFFHGIPVVTTYETTVVTATIMAGSSGSAVYNSEGKLSGLVFAGSQGLSYSFTVPYEFVRSFLYSYDDRKFTTIDYSKSLLEMLGGNDSKKSKEVLVLKCKTRKLPKQVAPICESILKTI